MPQPLTVEIVSGPAAYRKICEYVALHHRHHKPPQGWKWGVLARRGDLVVGCAVLGRPVARKLAGRCMEVTRICTWGSSRQRHGAVSAMLQAIADREPLPLVSYLLAEESGVSLLKSGWVQTITTPGKSWAVPTRPRVDKHPLGKKTRWESSPILPCKGAQ